MKHQMKISYSAWLSWFCVSVLLVGSTACTKPNALYCSSNDDCSDGRGCDLDSHSCTSPLDGPTTFDDAPTIDAFTGCVTSNECTTPEAPVCSADHVCRTCELDDECASGVCLESGKCEVEANILYVAPTGTGTACLASMPCQILQALSQVGSGKFTVHLGDGTYALTGTIPIANSAIPNVIIVGRKTAIVRGATSGPSFQVSNEATLTIRGFTLNRGVACVASTLVVTRMLFTNGGTVVHPWILMDPCVATIDESELNDSPSDGINADSGFLTITNSTIDNSASNGIVMIRTALLGAIKITSSSVSNNAGLGISSNNSTVGLYRSIFYKNRGGGISATGATGGLKIELVNNVIGYNGSSTTDFGGVRLEGTNPTGSFNFIHNTIAFNMSKSNALYAGGAYCQGPFTSPNNIIFHNSAGTYTAANAQAAGACNTVGSLVVNGASADELHFKSTTPPFDLRLGDNLSPAINVGQLGTLAEDIDGEHRPNGGLPDVGADEFYP